MRRFLLWTFRNRETGAVTVVQWPNAALWIVIVAAGLRFIWPWHGNADRTLGAFVTGGLLIWAADEFFRGVNPWRRFLGGAVAAFEIASVVNGLV